MRVKLLKKLRKLSKATVCKSKETKLGKTSIINSQLYGYFVVVLNLSDDETQRIAECTYIKYYLKDKNKGGETTSCIFSIILLFITTFVTVLALCKLLFSI